MAGNRSVLGIYRSRTDLERGVQALRDAGFSNNDISVLFSEGDKTREFAHEKGTKAPEGTAAGAASGAVIGGTLGWLAGIGSLAIPGIGPFIAAGPIMAALAGAGVGGTVGGLTGALIGLGIPEYEAKRYEGRVKEGGILVSVHCATSEQEDRVEDILERTGAEDISTKGESSADEEVHEGARDTGRRTTTEPVTSGTGTRMSGAGTMATGVGAGRAGAGVWSEYQADCRRDYETKYAHSGAQWNTMEPAYQYGHRMAADPRYRGRSWSEVESDMRASYAREHPNSNWDSVKDAVRYGWERVSGRR